MAQQQMRLAGMQQLLYHTQSPYDGNGRGQMPEHLVVNEDKNALGDVLTMTSTAWEAWGMGMTAVGEGASSGKPNSST